MLHVVMYGILIGWTVSNAFWLWRLDRETKERTAIFTKAAILALEALAERKNDVKL